MNGMFLARAYNLYARRMFANVFAMSSASALESNQRRLHAYVASERDSAVAHNKHSFSLTGYSLVTSALRMLCMWLMQNLCVRFLHGGKYVNAS